MNDRLLEEVKNYLDITWEMDAGEQMKLAGIIARGEKYLEGKIGQCDFESDTQEKELLMNYVMYVRAGRLSDFINHYLSEIISLQINRWRARKHAESERQ